MKKLFFLLLLPVFVKAQDRIDRNTAKLSSPIGNLSIATGWCKNQEGRWISRVNRIPIGLAGQRTSLIDFEKYKPGVDNFIYYQLRKLIYNNDTLAIFLKKSKTGYYKYPAIEEDWQECNICDYYLFDTKYLSGLVIKQDTIEQIEIPVIQNNSTGFLIVNKNEILSIENQYTPLTEDAGTLIIRYKSNSETRNVDFIIYFEFPTAIGNVYTGFNLENCNESFGTGLFGFDDGYFETSITNFSKLFPIRK